MNPELTTEVKNILLIGYPNSNIDTGRNMNPGKDCFYVQTTDGLYILKITDDCIDKHSEKTILDAILVNCLIAMRENPEKTIVLKRDLSWDVVER